MPLSRELGETMTYNEEKHNALCELVVRLVDTIQWLQPPDTQQDLATIKGDAIRLKYRPAESTPSRRPRSSSAPARGRPSSS
jgi:hypothetical protein